MWNDLTMSQKAALIRMAVSQGITDINQIKSTYDRTNSVGSIYDGGGKLSGGFPKDSSTMWSRASSFYNDLIDAGMTPLQAAGLLGNIAVESSFDSKASNGTHFGYLQNQPEFHKHIIKYYGSDSHAAQMQFIKDGMQGRLRGRNTSIGKQLQSRFNSFVRDSVKATTPEEVAMLWEKHYERSGQQSLGKRTSYARYFYDKVNHYTKENRPTKRTYGVDFFPYKENQKVVKPLQQPQKTDLSQFINTDAFSLGNYFLEKQNSPYLIDDISTPGSYLEYKKYEDGGPIVAPWASGTKSIKPIIVTGYPLVEAESEGLLDYFNNNPNVGGMAIGAGLNGINGERRVVLNPNLTDDNSRNSVYMNESYRHYFDENNIKLPIITNIQRNAYKGTPYENLDTQIQRTEVARYLSGDPSHHLNNLQKAQLHNRFKFVYPKEYEYINSNPARYARRNPIWYALGGDFLLNVKDGEDAGGSQCAWWQNKKLRESGYIASGNAWNLNDVDVVYSGYNPENKPKEYDRKAIEEYNHNAADNVFKEFDSKTLDKDKPYVVNMYYNGSHSQEEAYNNGRGVTGTHTGLLTHENGKWWVTHNIDGTIHRDRFIDLQNGNRKYGVTTIYKPRLDTFLNRAKGIGERGLRLITGFGKE